MPTVRAAATAEVLLDRYGVVTRGAVQAERVPGGFALVYKTLAALEEAGRARRGYFVEHLGAAQFSTAGTVDRLRSHDPRHGRAASRRPSCSTLAATDPANPYGAALPWPEGRGGRAPAGPQGGRARRARRRRLVAYVERGGTHGAAVRRGGGGPIARRGRPGGLVRGGGVPQLVVEKVDGEFALGSPFGKQLEAAGFAATPKGLRLRA